MKTASHRIRIAEAIELAFQTFDLFAQRLPLLLQRFSVSAIAEMRQSRVATIEAVNFGVELSRSILRSGLAAHFSNQLSVLRVVSFGLLAFVHECRNQADESEAREQTLQLIGRDGNYLRNHQRPDHDHDDAGTNKQAYWGNFHTSALS